MGNLKLRKLIERDTIYKDKYKEFRHTCKFEVHSILKVFNLDGKCSYYDVVKCNECLSFKSIAKKGSPPINSKIIPGLDLESIP